MVIARAFIMAFTVGSVLLSAASARRNPYSYFFSRPSSADAYSAMGDIDWNKRSYDNWINPSYGYSSMADAEWGWKKRGSHDSEEPKSYSPLAISLTQPKRTAYHSSYIQPYIRPSSRSIYSMPRAYARYSAYRPQTRKNGERQYGYASMADMDWGWKKRSQIPAGFGAEENFDLLEDGKAKKNIASLAKYNMFPIDDDDEAAVGKEKRHIGSLKALQSLGLPHEEMEEEA